MVFRRGLSRSDATGSWQVSDRTPDSSNWRHLKRQWRFVSSLWSSEFDLYK
ncbi:hypothetical protein LC613_36225 [Nostoc sphaeroides CHAB 2801]|uniref:hypothetical protein n=1 Tax=Nostoc sphaeroides TaxID=446679 RepID=UPI001E3ADCE7|nr:hypothetical protein [Nostoc sphaeroides]MCC5632982.1 hypothetical protein [Nostoc sphaeroides CHAB 2801]